ncbi:MAG: hypothetical protein IBX47_08460 [Desulfuromonadales bacterium]|nr:hypothetical protein [Desulfuromonadales bacterium]
MSPKSFAIRIFLADGVKMIAKSEWGGRCMVMPRNLFVRESEREELAAAGSISLSAKSWQKPTCFSGICSASVRFWG